ncbi:hypothetical protein J6590_006633 [Homalodisca vitripennis]|nr:hypothetical protein J6590_006633 [Homalodisca vitripennis]
MDSSTESTLWNADHVCVVMISCALVCDAVIGNVQEKSMRAHGASNTEVVLYSYSIGFVYLLVTMVLTGALWPGLSYCSQEHSSQASPCALRSVVAQAKYSIGFVYLLDTVVLIGTFQPGLSLCSQISCGTSEIFHKVCLPAHRHGADRSTLARPLLLLSGFVYLLDTVVLIGTFQPGLSLCSQISCGTSEIFHKWNDGRWWVLAENVFFQDCPDVGRCYKIGGVGWVRKVCSKGDETVAKGLLEESNVVNGSVTGCIILLDHCEFNGRFRARQNLLRSLTKRLRMALYRY